MHSYFAYYNSNISLGWLFSFDGLSVFLNIWRYCTGVGCLLGWLSSEMNLHIGKLKIVGSFFSMNLVRPYYNAVSDRECTQEASWDLWKWMFFRNRGYQNESAMLLIEIGAGEHFNPQELSLKKRLLLSGSPGTHRQGELISCFKWVKIGIQLGFSLVVLMNHYIESCYRENFGLICSICIA